MKNHVPAGRGLRFSTGRDRLAVILVTLVFAALVGLALSGRFDRELAHGARWIEQAWDRAATAVRGLGD